MVPIMFATTISGGYVVQDFCQNTPKAWYFLRDDRFFSIFTYLGYDIDDVNGLRHFAMTPTTVH